ncbi:outer membrane protein assembly factor BamB family protein [Erythrobacter crassostreae]|uniref:PQQ-binding-like beta-propeller repeat protein n=1 Tax=Erythrobacter crassostreae TaxID=2828328 RepID=A0A9X1F4J5_9SPHN|nr:PQQ-binding-like beta-propeller repeat protein [Erythrobacter crassostrea]MBV7258665.1 PQQ-binding-like beta-propeller repeat protein [Erythrobacter crassostrea]
MKSSIAVLGMLCAALAACSPPVVERATDLPESGKAALAERLYAENCASCHDGGINGAPTREALEGRSQAQVLASMNGGIMQAQSAALSAIDRIVLSEYLGKGQSSREATGPRCEGALRFSGSPLWNRWGNSKANTRFQTRENAGLDESDVERLELAWAFGFPGAQRARSQPAVTKEALFTGSQSGHVYALNPQTGCIWWSYDARAEVRNAPVIATGSDGTPETLYFGDVDAVVHAVDPRTGKERWSRSLRDHPDGTITGSIAWHEGTLFVPMSSLEVVSAYDDQYACCTFRGGITALDADSGEQKWRWYSVDKPEIVGKTRAGVNILAPSGAPVWSTPAIDEKRGLLYVGTGENYSSPANGNSDAIVALSLASGSLRWVSQTIAGDAWNASCGRDPKANCPEEDGPDFDFGAGPILVELPSGKDMILAGQKSGEVFGMDPDNKGRIVWRERAGMGGFNGGIHWGMASDGKTLWVPIADTPGNRFTVGPARPGIHAFEAATGRKLWSRIEKPTCEEPGYACQTALSAPLTAIPSVVFAGAHNGKLLAYSAHDGRVLWMQETNKAFTTVNGVEARGGSIDSAGVVVAGGMVFVNSGYDKFGEIGGNVLLAYRPRGETN